MIILAGVYWLFTLYVVVYEIRRPKAAAFDLLSMFNLFFCLYYLVPAAILATGWNSQFGHPVAATLSPPFGTNAGESALAIALTYALVLAGFASRSARAAGGRLTLTGPHVHGGLLGALPLAAALLAIAAAAAALYVSQYGGLVPALEQAKAIRAGAVTPGAFSFAKRFLHAAGLALCVLTAGAVSTPRLRSLAVFWLLTGIGVALTVASAFLLGGRGVLIKYALLAYLVVVLVKGHWRIRFAVPLVAGGVGLLLFGNDLFWAMSRITGGWTDVWAYLERSLAQRTTDTPLVSGMASLLVNFQHLVISLEGAFARDVVSRGELRFFLDVPYGVASLLPTSWSGIHTPATIATFNTYVLTGVERSIIPPGIIAFLLYSAWWPGLIAGAYCWGWCGRVLQEGMLRQPSTSYLAPMLLVAGGHLWAYQILSGEPRVFLQENIVLLVLFGVVVGVFSARPGRGAG